MGGDGLFEHGGRVMPFEKRRRVEIDRGRGDERDGNNGDKNLRRINDHGAANEAQDEPERRQRLARTRDDKPQRPAGEKDEHFRRIGEGHVPVGEALVKNARYVIDEDRRESEAAPEIDFVRGSHSGEYGFLASSRDRKP